AFDPSAPAAIAAASANMAHGAANAIRRNRSFPVFRCVKARYPKLQELSPLSGTARAIKSSAVVADLLAPLSKTGTFGPSGDSCCGPAAYIDGQDSAAVSEFYVRRSNVAHSPG